MAADAPRTLFGRFSGKKRTRPLPTLAIAVLVTSAVAVPLIFLAIDARNNPDEVPVIVAPADAQLVVFDSATTAEPEPLDLATVSGNILVSVEQASASSVSFKLFAAGADLAIIESVDADGPVFDLNLGESGRAKPIDTTLLFDGEYELFVTIRTPEEARRTAVGFTVQNS